jgi:hypothetical protein
MRPIVIGTLGAELPNAMFVNLADQTILTDGLQGTAFDVPSYMAAQTLAVRSITLLLYEHPTRMIVSASSTAMNDITECEGQEYGPMCSDRND